MLVPLQLQLLQSEMLPFEKTEEAANGNRIRCGIEFDANGRVVAADVVTPTAINAASIERHIGRAIEQSAERDIPTLTRKAEMIARAYDPCISCSTHCLDVECV